MRIGELARQTGIAPSALRYYEAVGLLRPPQRTASGYRRYGAAAVGRLQFIQRAKTLGLSMREVRQLLEGPAAGGAEEWRRLRHLVAHKLAATRSRIAELERLRGDLEALYVRLDRGPGPACGHVGDCACWLPTEKEVMKMAKETDATEACCCAGCECPDDGECACGEATGP